MNKQLEFMDCPNCGKRILTSATQCHHCKQAPRNSLPMPPARQVRSRQRPNQAEHDDDELSEHMSLEHGGYDDADDFDYDNYVAEEFPDQTDQRPKLHIKRWVWITAWLLILATLLPLIMQFMSTQ